MKKIVVYIPLTHKEIVKEAMFSKGAGRYDGYEKCSFETIGIGQFLPTKESNPYLGNKNELTHVEEVKVEMVCATEYVQEIVDAIKSSHPYEVPAFEVYDLLTSEYI